MRSDLTDITLVIDRSGSMQARQEDAQGGVNAFIQQQAAEPGGMGIHAAAAADFSMDKVAAAYDAASSKVSRMRSQRRAHQPVSNEFTEEEREKMK